MPIQSELLLYVTDWLLPLLEKQVDDDDIRQEKVQSELSFQMSMKFKSYQKTMLEIEKKFGAESKEVSNFTAKLNAIHGPVLARWKELKQKTEADGGEDSEEMADYYQELIDTVLNKLAKYKLPIPPAGAAYNVNKEKHCAAKSSTLPQDNAVACQPPRSKVVDMPVPATTASEIKNPIVKTSLTKTMLPPNESQKSAYSIASNRRTLAEFNKQQHEETAPRKSCLKKLKINEENVQLTMTKSVNFNISKATPESNQSIALSITLSNENNKADDKTDSVVPDGGGDNNNSDSTQFDFGNDNNSGSIQFDFSGSPLDINTSFNLDMSGDDKGNNASTSFDLGGFNMTDEDDNGTFPDFKF